MAKKDSCPICGKPVSPVHTPFCSQGCRDRDLLQWLGEGYRIPAGPAEHDEENSPPPGLDSANDPD
ncbi:DNA gyrase inhibitor YacG [Sphingomonas oligophenolica]|uniref:DNA gyrase inhibitor YacG n=1 Tax=Sphingomonas oligophenolica TaxID=301154 RepID=A0ABU9XZE6_9SPHN